MVRRIIIILLFPFLGNTQAHVDSMTLAFFQQTSPEVTHLAETKIKEVRFKNDSLYNELTLVFGNNLGDQINLLQYLKDKIGPYSSYKTEEGIYFVWRGNKGFIYFELFDKTYIRCQWMQSKN